MTNDTVNNVYCATLKQKQSSLYSKTVLHNDNNTVNTSILVYYLILHTHVVY